MFSPKGDPVSIRPSFVPDETAYLRLPGKACLLHAIRDETVFIAKGHRGDGDNIIQELIHGMTKISYLKSNVKWIKQISRSSYSRKKIG